MAVKSIDSDAAVIAARDKLSELQTQLEAAKAEYAAAANQQSDTAAQRQSQIDALLDGRDVASLAAPNVAALRQRVNLLSAAVDRQKAVVAECEHAAGLAIANGMQGEHAEVLGELAKAVAALRDAADKYGAFCNRLADAGAKWSSVFELLPFVGRIDPTAPTWLANSWLGKLSCLYPKLARGLA